MQSNILDPEEAPYVIIITWHQYLSLDKGLEFPVLLGETIPNIMWYAIIALGAEGLFLFSPIWCSLFHCSKSAPEGQGEMRWQQEMYNLWQKSLRTAEKCFFRWLLNYHNLEIARFPRDLF